jgi:hypothetical protein
VDANTVAITVGVRTKSVRILYLMNWVQEGNGKLCDASRAERIHLMIPSWLVDAKAADLRAQHRVVSDAASNQG